MNLALFYDTETTGLPDWSKPSEAPHQPHLVQLAGALVDLDTRQTLSSMDVIIKPHGWNIPEEVAAVHGITNEIAGDLGVSEESAIAMFLSMWDGRTRIAHNESFDARILRIAQKRYPNVCSEALCDTWKTSTAKCTAKLATPIIKLPPTEKMRAAGRFHHKTASLSEAYEYFTGKSLVGAHSAMVDVQACMTVYFAIHDSQNRRDLPTVQHTDMDTSHRGGYCGAR